MERTNRSQEETGVTEARAALLYHPHSKRWADLERERAESLQREHEDYQDGKEASMDQAWLIARGLGIAVVLACIVALISPPLNP